jgi:hypothetical protein
MPIDRRAHMEDDGGGCGCRFRVGMTLSFCQRERGSHGGDRGGISPYDLLFVVVVLCCFLFLLFVVFL